MLEYLRLIIGLSMLCASSIYAQQYDQAYFRSPVDHEIILAGSFGELRSTHFHAGIDIKPAGKKSIDTLRAAADGFVSRIKIQAGGYGKALYIDHPNGHTTVYAHLNAYEDELNTYIENIQKKNKSYALEIYPDSSLFQYKKGEFIGFMGNTGQSYGKHLHFEIRETKTEIPVNPALWGLKPIDNIPPQVLSLDLHSLSPDFVSVYRQTFPLTDKQRQLFQSGNKLIKVPGWRCGMAVQAFDQMNGASNKNGVYYQKLYVDDTLYYAYTMDKVGFDETKYINAHVDYPARKKEKRTLVRCFVVPGNPLSIYDSLNQAGVFKVYEDRPRNIKLVLGDIEGNETILKCKIYRDDTIDPRSKSAYNIAVSRDTVSTIKWNDIEVSIPENAVDHVQYLSYNVTDGTFQFGDEGLILFKNGSITMPIDSFPSSAHDKLYIAYSEDGEKWSSLGGKINQQQIHSKWKHGGLFRVCIDSLPPTLIMDNNLDITPGKMLTLILEDQETSISDYQVFIDDRWIISPYKSLTKQLQIPIPASLSKGNHNIVIKAVDERNNILEIKKEWSY